MEAIVKRIYMFVLLALAWSGSVFSDEHKVFKGDFEGPALITDFSAEPATIASGKSATISWKTEHATSCSTSNGAGDWGSQAIVLPAGSAEILISEVKDHTFTLTCTGEAGDPAVAEVIVTSLPPVAITVFDATPATITAGESTTIRWATENTVACTPSGDALDWEKVAVTLPGGNTQIMIPDAGNYTFTLTCEGEGGDIVPASTVVTVTEPQINNCTPPPLIGNTWQWADFWGQAFPLPTYGNELIDIYRFGYGAIQFYTGSVVDHGLLVTVGVTYTGGIRLGAVTKCPGDFNAPPECEHSWGIGGGIGGILGYKGG